MTAHKNLCSGCGFNFGTMETFEKHRIGQFGKDRRCMTADEMRAKGWEYSEPLLTYYNEGKPYQKATPTWTLPAEQSRVKSLYRIRQN